MNSKIFLLLSLLATGQINATKIICNRRNGKNRCNKMRRRLDHKKIHENIGLHGVNLDLYRQLVVWSKHIYDPDLFRDTAIRNGYPQSRIDLVLSLDLPRVEIPMKNHYILYIPITALLL